MKLAKAVEVNSATKQRTMTTLDGEMAKTIENRGSFLPQSASFNENHRNSHEKVAWLFRNQPRLPRNIGNIQFLFPINVGDFTRFAGNWQRKPGIHPLFLADQGHSVANLQESPAKQPRSAVFLRRSVGNYGNKNGLLSKSASNLWWFLTEKTTKNRQFNGSTVPCLWAASVRAISRNSSASSADVAARPRHIITILTDRLGLCRQAWHFRAIPQQAGQYRRRQPRRVDVESSQHLIKRKASI
jgi:hypothetical protein